MPGSTARGNDLAEAQRLADLLIGQVDDAQRVALVDDPWATVVDHYQVPVSWHTPTTSKGCSISIAPAASRRRETFSLLHELAHHLQRRELQIASALGRLPTNKRSAMVEDVCDAFAAELLLPTSTVVDILDGLHPSGTTLRRLYEASGASRAACCVRLAQTMSTEGYVVLADDQAAISFVARAHAEYPLRRGVQQPAEGVIRRALRSGTARGKDRLTYASGWRTGMYHADAIFDGEWVYSVFQTRPPGTWAIGALTENERRPRPPEVDCAHCAATFEAWGDGCDRCNQPRCPDCARCACAIRPAYRTCQGCWLNKAIAQFVADNPICEDCGG